MMVPPLGAAKFSGSRRSVSESGATVRVTFRRPFQIAPASVRARSDAIIRLLRSVPRFVPRTAPNHSGFGRTAPDRRRTRGQGRCPPRSRGASLTARWSRPAIWFRSQPSAAMSVTMLARPGESVALRLLQRPTRHPATRRRVPGTQCGPRRANTGDRTHP